MSNDKMPPDKQLRAVVCRSTEGGPVAGYKPGYRCRNCAKELQASPFGQDLIADGGVPLCQDCGIKFAETAGNMGKLDGVLFGPNALGSVGAFEKDLEKELKKHELLYPVRPKQRTEVDPVTGRTTHYLDFRNCQDIPERPLLMTCDFCLANVDRLWGWRTWPVSIFKGRFRQTCDEESRWWACVHCAALVRDRERALRLLIARVTTMNPHLPVEMLELTYPVVLSVMHGDELRWNAGDKWRRSR